MSRSQGEQRTSARNVMRFALTHPRATLTLISKAVRRVADKKGAVPVAEANRWLAEHSQDAGDFAESINAELWAEAREFGEQLRMRAKPIIEGIPYDLGAGGDYEFLYWLTRLRKPGTIVETGVSAGWTSQAFLSALERNSSGHLYSSDFPYFRIPRPESVIGCLVEQKLRHRWSLEIEGDAINLPRIIRGLSRVDLFHYDSDKSYAGRSFGLNLIRPVLANDGLIVMDDITNNAHFFDEARSSNAPFSVFGSPPRFGVLGQISDET